MQHYQEVTAEKTPIKESLLKKYFAEAQGVAEQAAEQQAAEKQQQLSMYAQRIAKKVLEGNKDDAYTRDYKSKENTKEGILGDIKDAVMGKSAEEWAKTSTQMAALIKMRAQYPNNRELERRISDLEFRLNQGSGEVMSYDPKTGPQSPKVPQPPRQ
jgi:hypothetical protein